MSRAHLIYDERREFVTATGFDPDTPIAGLYRHRMVSGGVAVAVRIWFGPPVEPWTGEPMDRASRWNATVNGAWVEVDRVWPSCAAARIDEAEAAHLSGLQRWGADHGHAALADPRKRMSPLTSPMLF